jgi:hypothetical protein
MKAFAVAELVSGCGLHPANEDLIGCAGPFAWVMDGASAIGAKPWIDEVSDARWLVSQYDQAFRDLADPGVSCLDIVRNAISVVGSLVEATNDEVLIPSLALGIVKLEDAGVSYFGLGDTTVSLVDASRSIITPLDGVESPYDRAASREIQDLLSAGRTFIDATSQVYKRILSDRRKYMNRPNGYWTISTALSAIDHGTSGFVEMNLDEAFLLTDGFRRYFETYRLNSTLLDSIHEWTRSGLESALANLREVEESDPEMRRFPRISLSDDATCARLSVMSDGRSPQV